MRPLHLDLALMTDERLEEEYKQDLTSGGLTPLWFDNLGMPMPELKQMQKYFEESKNFPQYLVTQNNLALQKAYVSVSQNVWQTRILDLERALHSYRNAKSARRKMVTGGQIEEVSPLVSKLLDNAFSEKYEELIMKVENDFMDYFPYHVSATNPKVMLFQKMTDYDLVRYVMQRL